MTMAQRISELVTEHGSLRAAARFVGVDSAYLLRLECGDKTNPSKAVLRKLCMRHAITYYFVNGK